MAASCPEVRPRVRLPVQRAHHPGQRGLRLRLPGPPRPLPRTRPAMIPPISATLGTSVPVEPIPDVHEADGPMSRMSRMSRMSEHTVTFRLADPEHQLAGVRLVQDVRIPGDQLGFHRSGDRWELVIDLPPV